MEVKIVCDIHCPGKEGNRTTTTYSVVPSEWTGTPLWKGESDFQGHVLTQVYTSSSYSGLEFQEPQINPQAPTAIVQVVKELAGDNWRCNISA